MPSRPKVVVLGMMTKMPVAGVVWQTVHYLVGLERLGCEVYYVEAHARTPSMLMSREDDDGVLLAAEFIDGVLRRFDLAGRWAYHALHEDGRILGLSEAELGRLYRSAAMILNLHGGTEPRPEHYETGRLVYLETDPGQLHVELHDGVQSTIDFLEHHVAFFTFGENYGNPGCGLPVCDRFTFRPTRQPVVLDFWQQKDIPAGERFTTIGNWRQDWRPVQLGGETYHWSKHREFAKFLDLPRRSGANFELALSSFTDQDRRLLERHGWHVRPALPLSRDQDSYRAYITRSRGEFTVAKDQNVRLRSGWFSDRSATYLAAGRPVITQDTGFGSVLPTGEGLFAYSTLDEAASAVDAINNDYGRHAETGGEIARDWFAHDVVLSELLSDIGVSTSRTSGTSGRPFPDDLELCPARKRPLVLPEATLRLVESQPVSATYARQHSDADQPVTSIVVVTFNELPVTRLCLESLLAHTSAPSFELIIVDNRSSDGTRDYLQALQRMVPNLRVILNGSNEGFAAAANQGLKAAGGRYLVLLNNDTIVPPGWLTRLLRHLDDPAVGMVGPITNAAPNESRVPVSYTTYGEFLSFAKSCANDHVDLDLDLEVLTMFCVAMRRDAFERIGLLDERFGLGLFEDDDYSRRMRLSGFRLKCVGDVFVHHFGEASFGRFAASGEYMSLFNDNRRNLEEKWGTSWTPHRQRPDEAYERFREEVRRLILSYVPQGAAVSVASKGDDVLIRLDGRKARHFPAMADGTYAGSYPGNDAEVISLVNALRSECDHYLVFPSTSAWWLQHYGELKNHLDKVGKVILNDCECVIYHLTAAKNNNAVSPAKDML